MKEIWKRIKALEVASANEKIPTYEQFCEQWESLGLLTQGLYVTMAECPELFGELDKRSKAICGYVERMGLVKETYTLKSILEDM